MELIEFKEQNTVFAKDQPQYNHLPAYVAEGDTEGRVVCCWELSVRERIRLLFTGKIWHQVLTFRNPLQPQLLTVGKPKMKGGGA